MQIRMSRLASVFRPPTPLARLALRAQVVGKESPTREGPTFPQGKVEARQATKRRCLATARQRLTYIIIKSQAGPSASREARQTILSIDRPLVKV
ncbi:MAG: hypothetical protein J2P36_08510 [Ktedonobacteraceae bacterium]|nr:hypothetical protein [Ktedonobacteraceae bacterium]